ncbi:MAG TPA: hypothetical protein VEB41_12075 [Burkholderiales bacterium]|nr:hypothetical protein [Burkholderiales bacterium]
MKRSLLCFALAAFCGAVQAENLGRLFFTPEQRQALDARRKARVPDKPAAAAVAASPTMRLDGYVKRSSGRSTVWVNGEPAEELPRLPGSSDGRVDVTIGETGARVGLKPGETLDRGNNEVSDVIGDGEIRVPRSATKP